MREANDLKISSAIRRELSSRRVDLSKLKFPVKAGEVSLQGELSFVGLEKTNDEIAIELKFIESSIKNVEGVSNIIFELTNWKKNDSGIWESSASSSNSPFKHIDGEGLVCPECDFVIRFCPCCGKPLVPGAKPGMHKASAPKPIGRKPNLPPIKPIIRKPRPIGAPSGSPISTPSIKSNSTIIPPINKSVVPPKTETTVPPIKTPLAKSDSEVKTPLTVANTPVAPAKEPINSADNNAVTNKSVDNKPETKAPVATTTTTSTSAPAKPSIAPKPLKPLRPLKPLAGLKPLNKPGVNAAKPAEAAPSQAQTPAPAAIPTQAPAEVQTPAPKQPEVSTPPQAPAEQITVQPTVEPEANTAFTPQNTTLSASEAVKPADAVPTPNSFEPPQSAFNLNTPIPDFMKNEDPGMAAAQQSLGSFPTPDSPQVPDLNFGLNPLGTDNQSQAPKQNAADNNPIPDISLDLNTLGNNTGQAPDLDLGLGFDLNMPTSPAPSSIPDLGLNMNSDQSSGLPPNLGMNLDIPDLSSNVPDLSQNSGSNAPNAGQGGDNLDIFGSLFQGQNGDDGLGNSSPMGGLPAQDDTPLPPMRPASQPSAPSGLSFDNLGDDDTPLPPMKPAQAATTPKAAPAKKKKNDIFDSLFNEINMGGSGGDGLGNLDLDLEVIPTGDSNGFDSAPATPAPQNTGNDNPFNLGDSGVLDLDSMLGSGSGSGNLGGKDESGAFNLDDFDISNFKL